ncbi:mitochondrial ornithine transporter 1-like [Oppia nitens]|uniref:mitochondrial ornithine transporter 1-like n=1 Tax=Oppia nitens TaxID=1686743 RepID=UPI0023D9A1EB|nr:mitochondrial ornithine transporter 1-like [Oppia nitens]
MSYSTSTDSPIRQLAIGFVDLMAGSAGGVANVLTGQPLDTIKVKMQTFPHLYNNTINCLKQTVTKDGWRGLYAGTTPALAANVAENSVLFCAYGFCQQMICQIRQTNSCQPIDNAFAGFFAAFFSSFTLCPTELIKCKLQALRETGVQTHIGSIQLTRQILQSEGVPGMFRGLTSTMAREMPGYFCFFGGYELAKSYLRTDPDEENLGLLKTTIAGGIGGMCLWTSIFPFDVVKSRIQIESSRQTMTAVLVKIVRTEGVRGLYKGLTPTLLRTFPSTGALFVAYENTKEFFTKVVDKTL